MKVDTSDKIYVQARQGRYDLLHPSQESISIHVRVPGLEVVNYNLVVEEAEQLQNDDLRWSDVAREAGRIYRESGRISSRGADHAALEKWLADPTDTNETLMDQAYAEWRLPGLQVRIERLTEKRDEVAKLLQHCREWLATPEPAP